MRAFSGVRYARMGDATTAVAGSSAGSILSWASFGIAIITLAAVAITIPVIEANRPGGFQKRVSGVCPNGTQAKAITATGGLICDGSVPAGEVGPEQIRDESITEQHMGNCSVRGGVDGIVCDGSIVAADVNPAQVQLRVTGMCTSGFVRRILEDGGVVCSTILAPSSAGTVQLVDGSVTTAKIANHSIGEYQLVLPDYGRGTPNGLATLDPSGKVPQSQLPNTAMVVNITVCSNSTGRTDGCCPRASGGVGNVCILPNATYIWQTDYIPFSAPDDQVQSVNGQVGTVVLNTDNIAQGTSNLYLRPNSVLATHLVNQSVTSAAIADMTIQSVDLGSAIITASKMAASSVAGGVGGTILDGSIVAADVNSAQVQLRVTGTCVGGGSTMTGVTSGGGVVCDNTASTHVAQTASNPHGTRLGQLIDVAEVGPTEGQVLTYTGGAWRNSQPSSGGGGGGITRLTSLEDVHIPYAKLVPLDDADSVVYHKEIDRWINHPVPVLGVIHANLFCTTHGRRAAAELPLCEVTGEGYHVVFVEIADKYKTYPVTITIEEPVGGVTAHVVFDSRTSTSFDIGMRDRDNNPTHVVISVMVMNPTKRIFDPSALPRDKKK